MLFTCNANAEHRVALVLDVHAYEAAGLKRSTPNLQPILKRLEAYGFRCTVIRNPDNNQIKREVEGFAEWLASRQSFGRRRALVASERRSPETWRAFRAELAAHGLSERELSAEAREVAGRAGCAFWIEPEQLGRMELLEICPSECSSSAP